MIPIAWTLGALTLTTHSCSFAGTAKSSVNGVKLAHSFLQKFSRVIGVELKGGVIVDFGKEKMLIGGGGFVRWVMECTRIVS